MDKKTMSDSEKDSLTLSRLISLPIIFFGVGTFGQLGILTNQISQNLSGILVCTTLVMSSYNVYKPRKIILNAIAIIALVSVYVILVMKDKSNFNDLCEKAKQSHHCSKTEKGIICKHPFEIEGLIVDGGKKCE